MEKTGMEKEQYEHLLVRVVEFGEMDVIASSCTTETDEAPVCTQQQPQS